MWRTDEGLIVQLIPGEGVKALGTRVGKLSKEFKKAWRPAEGHLHEATNAEVNGHQTTVHSKSGRNEAEYPFNLEPDDAREMLRRHLEHFDRYQSGLLRELMNTRSIWERMKRLSRDPAPNELLDMLEKWVKTLPKELIAGHTDRWFGAPNDYNGKEACDKRVKRIKRAGNVPIHCGFRKEPTPQQQKILSWLSENPDEFLGRLLHAMVSPMRDEIEQVCLEAAWAPGDRECVPLVESANDLRGLVEIVDVFLSPKGWPIGLIIVTPWVLTDEGVFGIQLDECGRVEMGQAQVAALAMRDSVLVE